MSVTVSLSPLQSETPDMMKAFSALAQTGRKDGTLDKEPKKIITHALRIAAHCEG
ncbi:hypothetical protein H8K36_03505 [Undibacterium sp. LX22W]|uniref:Carboxymuconolactone decarboxylase-like domain-containing protein n=1 Tax=Undibacterium nitidum TaxID=2762298 RepID=A0A923KSL7_9BURK|nr:hypothetical protein [Undibacterium nitidum]